MTKRTFWNNNSAVQAAYNSLWKKLVPDQDHCKTVEGEMLRAASKMYYRYYNDGDKVQLYPEEGERNSATSAHAFLTTVCPLNIKTFSKSKDYEKSLEKLLVKVVCFIRNKKGKYTPNLDLDYLDY